jgi:hypothetical protein
MSYTVHCGVKRYQTSLPPEGPTFPFIRDTTITMTRSINLSRATADLPPPTKGLIEILLNTIESLCPKF